MSTPYFSMSLRRARPDDAEGIAALYDEAYGDGQCLDAANHYPFPQFLNPKWLTTGVVEPNLIWLVAEVDDCIVGSAGAAWAHGTEEDRVAEVFGIVVQKRARGQRIASNLLGALRDMVSLNASFIVCECRTADPGALRVARRCGFMPVGLEPFAHATPIGSEAMLMTGVVCGSNPSSTHAASLTPRAAVVAGAVLDTAMIGAVESRSDSHLTRPYVFSCERDDNVGRDFLAKHARHPHDSGVVGLGRLEGDDHGQGRYDRRCYVASANTEVFGAIRLSWDRIDHRVRLLGLRTNRPGTQQAIIARIVDELQRTSAPEPLTIVIEIRGDAIDLQTALEELGFFPTVFFPYFLAANSGRIGVVQYTLLFRQEFSQSLSELGDMDWPEAIRVVNAVQCAAMEVNA